MTWAPLLWLALALSLLFLAERWIHRHLQGLALLVAREPQAAVVLYALPLLPGIVLHELSHALAGVLMGVRVGRISIKPKLSRGRIQLGYVPIERTDAVRSSLIGLAPLVVGSLAIVLIGYAVFGLEALSGALPSGDLVKLRDGLLALARTPDAVLWAYVIFAISNTMMPSRSDRQSWTPVLLFLGLVAAIVGVASVVTGQTAQVAARLAQPGTTIVRWLATACTFTIAMDVPFMVLVLVLEKLVSRVTGMQVDY